MQLEKSPRLIPRVPTAAAIVFLSLSNAAQAGGGFPDPAFAGSASVYSSGQHATGAGGSVTVDVEGDGIEVTSTTGAEANAGHRLASVGVWDTTSVSTKTSAGSVTVDSTSLTVAFSKGVNSIAKGESITEVAVTMNGNTYLVSREVALAFARSTQFGSTSAVEVDASGTPIPGGNSTTLVSTSKPTSR
jgi:hypothetical protein